MNSLASGWIPLLTAIIGAAVALVGKEIIAWWRRPKLIIDFESSVNEYPVIQDYNDMVIGGDGSSSRVIMLRLNVVNRGKTTAYDCEAKMDLVTPVRKSKYRQTLHWSKHHPAIYKSPEQIYSPINLNRNDSETLDTILLRYGTVDSDPKKIQSHMETYSAGGLQLYGNEDYYIKVTIYARNTTSRSFNFRVNWNSTIEGFNPQAFMKIGSIPKEFLMF
jgi:hypothetical protein